MIEWLWRQYRQWRAQRRFRRRMLRANAVALQHYIDRRSQQQGDNDDSVK